MSAQSIETLPKEQKQVLAKVGLDLNISAQKIADVLGVHRTTVYRYAERPTPSDLRQFATEIRSMIFVKQQEVLADLLSKISTEIKDTYDVRSLAFTYGVISKNQQELEQEHKETSNDMTISFESDIEDNTQK